MLVKEQREHPEKRLLSCSSEERRPTGCEWGLCGDVRRVWFRARFHWCAVETSPPPEERCAVSASAPASRAALPSPSSETPASSACSGASSWLSRTPPPDYCSTQTQPPLIKTATSSTNTAVAAKYQFKLNKNINNILERGEGGCLRNSLK